MKQLVNVSGHGIKQHIRALSGFKTNRDGERPVRIITGLARHLPIGYSVNGGAAAATDRLWTMSFGISQLQR